MKTLNELKNAITNTNAASAWKRGVQLYAADIIDSATESAAYNGNEPHTLEELLRFALNGADNWAMFSEGGCALIYNTDIANRLCSPSELRRVDFGRRNPNNSENWIDCQTRALVQAWRLIESVAI